MLASEQQATSAVLIADAYISLGLCSARADLFVQVAQPQVRARFAGQSALKLPEKFSTPPPYRYLAADSSMSDYCLVLGRCHCSLANYWLRLPFDSISHLSCSPCHPAFAGAFPEFSRAETDSQRLVDGCWLAPCSLARTMFGLFREYRPLLPWDLQPPNSSPSHSLVVSSS